MPGGGSGSSAKLVASYGEMDCVATLAAFDLAQAVNSAHARSNTGPAAPLLRLLLVLRPDPQSLIRLRQMLPFLRSAVNGGEVENVNEPPARHLLTVAVGAGYDTERTGLPAGLVAALTAARARVVCLACSWDKIRSRADAEPEAAWAARVVGEIMCEIVPAAPPVKGPPGSKPAKRAAEDRAAARRAMMVEVAGALRGLRAMDGTAQMRACVAVCGWAQEPPVLCDCAVEIRGHTRPAASAQEAGLGVVRGGGYQVVLLVATGEEALTTAATPPLPPPPPPSNSPTLPAWTPTASRSPLRMLGVACALRDLHPHAILATAVPAAANRSLPEINALLRISDALLAPTARMALQLADTGAQVGVDTDFPEGSLGMIEGLALERVQRPPTAGVYPAVCASAHGAVGPT